MQRTSSSARPRLVAHVRLLIAAAAVLCLSAFAAPQAQAVNTQLKEEFAKFLDCPTATAGVCVVAHTTSGEFKMGLKDVPIEKTITLQGGLPINSLSDSAPDPGAGRQHADQPAAEGPGRPARRGADRRHRRGSHRDRDARRTGLRHRHQPVLPR